MYVEGTNLWYASGTTGGQWWQGSPTLQRFSGSDTNADGILTVMITIFGIMQIHKVYQMEIFGL